MTPELQALKNVAERLDSGGFRYMLTGSMALSAYVRPRMTRDIDLVVEITSGDATRVVALFSPDYYVSDTDVNRALGGLGMFNVLDLRDNIKIDIIVRKESPYRLQEFARRQRVSLSGFDVWVVSKEDLILSKLVWGKDSRDTTPEFQRLYEARIMALSPAERIEMCASMFETARTLAEASLPPGLTESERRRRLCELFYGKELADKAFPR